MRVSKQLRIPGPVLLSAVALSATDFACSTSSSPASTFGSDAADAATPSSVHDASMSCLATLEDYCAKHACVSTWTEAQNAGSWCALDSAFDFNGSGIVVAPACSDQAYDTISFGSGVDATAHRVRGWSHDGTRGQLESLPDAGEVNLL